MRPFMGGLSTSSVLTLMKNIVELSTQERHSCGHLYKTFYGRNLQLFEATKRFMSLVGLSRLA